MKIGKCKVGGELPVILDPRGMCSMCAFKFDSADKRASNLDEIRQDMEASGVPVVRKIYYPVERKRKELE